MHGNQATAYEMFSAGEEPTALLDQPAGLPLSGDDLHSQKVFLMDFQDYLLEIRQGCPCLANGAAEQIREVKGQWQSPAGSGEI